MPCNHKRVWEYQSVAAFHPKHVEELCADGFEPFGVAKGMPSGYQPYDGEYAFDCIQLKRLKPCDECPKVLERVREEVEKLRKEHSKHIQKVHEARWERMRNQGLVD